jgi:hypothetical protein
MNKPLHNNPSYTIRIQGHLTGQSARRFTGLTLTLLDDGSTLLSGALDQAALHGLLSQIRDLGLPLLALERREEDAGDAPAHKE